MTEPGVDVPSEGSPGRAGPPGPSGHARPPRSLRRSFAATVLVGEVLVVGFASLVAMRLTDVSGTALAVVAAGTALLCLLAAALLRSRAGYVLGWLVQLLLVASGFWVPMMFFVGIVFAALWAGALRYGGQADRITERRLRQAG